uniref:Fibrinogen C-terminal domain-containing protein n=1 Tax=Acrobeloides nanus TaxID=290746 RepID=A0A914CLG8_9BILA
MQYVGSGNYTGFRLSLNATDYRQQHAVIDAFNHTFATMEEQYNDFAYYSHFREGVDEPTLIAIAWKVEGTDIKPLPTDRPTTTTTTTLPPNIYPYDCSDRTKVPKSDVYKIQPNPLDPNNIVRVYCDVGDNDAYTVVQSRGGSGDDDFPTKNTLADYTTPFGTPGVDTNFWFGLDNFYYLTSYNNGYNYNLQIDLCCGDNLAASLHYDNFKVSGSSDGYVLKATAEVNDTGIGSPGPGGAMPDIGSKFSTYDDYQGVYSKKICSVYKYTRSDNDANAIGGWWVGSCTNNLNGYFYGVGDPIFYQNNTCQINTVRMALYRVDPGYGIPTNTANFCTATPTTPSGTENAPTGASINSET